MRRILEWDQVAGELGRLLKEEFGRRPRALPPDRDRWGDPDEIHKALLAGMPQQIGVWEKEKRFYRGTRSRNFAIFPGSGLFGRKRPEWVLGFDLVETTRLWARKVASIEPEWVEEVAPQLCRSRFHSPYWEPGQGAVYGVETVVCGGLTIVPERRVHFGRVDPRAAHEVFVREAILGGGIHGRCRCLDRLAEVRAEVERAEHKLRRSGALWSDEAAYDFFFKRIPADVATTREFHDWRSKDGNEERLMIRMVDVVWEEIADRLELFPDTVHHDRHDYDVAYRSDPAAPDDGLCFEVAVDDLPRLPDHLVGWGVPGMLAERVELLVRSLPKWRRQACAPIASAVGAFLELWRDWEPDRELTGALAEFLAERSGHDLTAGEFDLERLPGELRPKLRVVGDEGEELALGEDTRAIKDRLAGLLRQRRESAANLEWEMSGGEVWSFGELPAEADGIFPALVDEGRSVGLRAFLDPEEAGESHRAGCVRLFLLEHGEQADYVRKRFPLGAGARLFLPLLSAGSDPVDDLLRCAAEGALREGHGSLPRSGEEFAGASGAGKGLLFACAGRVAEAFEEVVESYRRVSDWIEEHRDDRHLAPVAVDLDRELAWLLRDGFAWKAGYPRMRRYQRYFFGVEERIRRLGSQPLIRDEEKRARISPYWDEWFEAWRQNPEAARFWPAGWQLEELRLQFFAPSQPRESKVSEKRIEKVLEGLRG
jgi:ATP-dependent helicase HrpA